jgi:hypothetical protein
MTEFSKFFMLMKSFTNFKIITTIYLLEIRVMKIL